MAGFINEDRIFSILESSKNIGKDEIIRIIEKASNAQGLTIEEVGKLLFVEDKELLSKMIDVAKKIKNIIYGKRVVLFAPLYTSNECNNNCLYCAFRRDNKLIHRKTLSNNEILTEAKEISEQGHKRILLICGEENEKNGAKHLADAMKLIYKNLDIRRINIEAAPMEIEDYKLLKESGIGTYVLFQETYNSEVYKKMHPEGRKSNYEYRLNALDRAIEAGVDDVGVGALLGLYDYRFEVLGILMHIQHLEEKFGIGAHTISVPRLTTAHGAELKDIPYKVCDEDFKKIVAIYRMAVPYTGIILSTRENSKFRDELLSIGISQISAGSKTSPGGYKDKEEKSNQFEVSDERTLKEVIETICENGYIPSFCTACYRRCRTGEAFMELAKEGEIHEFCQPNAILTFKENLIDFGDEKLKIIGEKIIEDALTEITDIELKKKTIEKIKEIENGKRDLFF